MKKKVLILVYSHVGRDPRVLRQMQALKDSYALEVAGFSAPGDPSIPFHPIYTEPPFSLLRKLRRFSYFLFRRFDKYYWDDGKMALVEKLKPQKYDVVIANDIQTLPLALSIAGTYSKVYFDAHDYHPREFEDNLAWRVRHQPFVLFLCKKYIHQAHAFSTTSEGFAREYEKFTGKLPVLVTNATVYHDLHPSPVDPSNIKIVHHGAAIPSRKIELMVDMALLLDSRFKVDFLLIGSNPEYIRMLKTRAAGNPRIQFPEPVGTESLCIYTNSYDLGIFLLFPNNFNYIHCLPNKLFEFVQARLGIVVSPNPEMAKLVDTNSLGIVSPDYRPDTMAALINALTPAEIQKFKENAHKAASFLNADENIRKIKSIVDVLSGK